jgi:hypothetical protein
MKDRNASRHESKQDNVFHIDANRDWAG